MPRIPNEIRNSRQPMEPLFNHAVIGPFCSAGKSQFHHVTMTSTTFFFSYLIETIILFIINVMNQNNTMTHNHSK